MSVRDFFKGKRILITGGSGFIGKALIEKLLRSCDGIDKIYVLLREKKGLTAEERLKVITDNVLFDKLKANKPETLKKLIPIAGDVKECKLGLSDQDRQTLIENVNIIYHGAASVRFDDFLKDSLLLNTRGAREIVELALEIKNLLVFMHISTTYCNTDKKIIEEKIYPAHADWRSSIKIAEEVDKHTLEVLTEKYIAPLINTYTFAKSLSEHVVNDLCKGKLPAVILRPSVVVSSVNDPIPAWADNFNGPVGMLLAGGTGLLKVYYASENEIIDFLPVDLLAKMIILATLRRAENKNIEEIEVYNTSAIEAGAICSNKGLLDVGSKLTWDAPITQLFWYPSFSISSNWYIYYLLCLIYQVLPALVGDGFLKLFGKAPFLLKVQRKIFIAYSALQYFTHNTWIFKNDKVMSPSFNSLPECEMTDFSFLHVLKDATEEEVYVYYLKAKIGVLEILLKQKFDFEKGYRNTLIMWIMDRLLHFTVYGYALWYLLIKIDMLTAISSKFLLYWSNL